MTTPNPAAPAAAPTSAPAAEPNPTNPAANSPAEPTPQPATLDPVALQAKLEKSVQAEKNLRARLQQAEAAEAELKALKEKDLSEAEKLKAKLTELETANAKTTAEANALRARVVAQANGCEPEAAALWLQSQNLSEWTDDALKTALASAPAWVKAQAAPGVTTQPVNPARPGSSLTLEAINQMTPEQIAANYDQVLAGLNAAGTR